MFSASEYNWSQAKNGESESAMGLTEMGSATTLADSPASLYKMPSLPPPAGHPIGKPFFGEPKENSPQQDLVGNLSGMRIPLPSGMPWKGAPPAALLPAALVPLGAHPANRISANPQARMLFFFICCSSFLSFDQMPAQLSGSCTNFSGPPNTSKSRSTSLAKGHTPVYH